MHPAKVESVWQRARTEIDVTHNTIKQAVEPRTHNKPLLLSGAGAFAVGAHASKIPQRTFEKDVVPAANMQGRHINLCILRIDADFFPILIERGMGEPSAIMVHEPR